MLRILTFYDLLRFCFVAKHAMVIIDEIIIPKQVMYFTTVGTGCTLPSLYTKDLSDSVGDKLLP